jgi:hypothetical protein
MLSAFPLVVRVGVFLYYWFGVGEDTLQIHHLISSYTLKKKIESNQEIDHPNRWN